MYEDEVTFSRLTAETDKFKRLVQKAVTLERNATAIEFIYHWLTKCCLLNLNPY